MASRFEKETAQTSEREQQSHRNSAEYTRASSRHTRKPKSLKITACGHIRDPTFLLLVIQKELGNQVFYSGKTFFSELSLMKRAFLSRERKDREDWRPQI